MTPVYIVIARHFTWLGAIERPMAAFTQRERAVGCAHHNNWDAAECFVLEVGLDDEGVSQRKWHVQQPIYGGSQ